MGGRAITDDIIDFIQNKSKNSACAS